MARTLCLAPALLLLLAFCHGNTSSDCDRNTMDLVFVVDESLSVAAFEDTGFSSILGFLVNIVQLLTVSQSEVRVAFVSFSDNARTEFHLKDYSNASDVIKRIGLSQYITGGTATGPALQLVIDDILTVANGVRFGSPQTILLITDGIANIGQSPSIPANLLKAGGCRIIVIGVGDQLYAGYLQEIASSKSDVFTTDLFSNLYQLLPDMQNQLLCPDKKVCVNGGTLASDGSCTCTPDFGGKICEECRRSSMDLVFVVDESLSVTLNDPLGFQRILNFIIYICSNLFIEMSHVRVAMVSFSDSPKLEFYLDQYTSQVQLIRRINSSIYVPGGTATGPALELVRDEVLAPQHGSRADKLEKIILITDGVANIGVDPRSPAADLKGRNVQTIAVGVGDQLSLPYLQSIASSNSDAYQVATFADLSDFAAKLLSVLEC